MGRNKKNQPGPIQLPPHSVQGDGQLVNLANNGIPGKLAHCELSCELIHLSCRGLEGSQGRQEIIGCRILVCVSGPDPPIPEHR